MPRILSKSFLITHIFLRKSKRCQIHCRKTIILFGFAHNVFYYVGNYFNEYLHSAKRIMTKRSIKLFTLLIPITLLVGCGQMGPLYLPKDDTATVAKSTETSNATKTSATAAQSADTSNNDKPSNKSVDATNNDDKDKQSAQSNTTLPSSNEQTTHDDAEAKQDIQNTENQQDPQGSNSLQNQSE